MGEGYLLENKLDKEDMREWSKAGSGRGLPKKRSFSGRSQTRAFLLEPLGAPCPWKFLNPKAQAAVLLTWKRERFSWRLPVAAEQKENGCLIWEALRDCSWAGSWPESTHEQLPLCSPPSSTLVYDDPAQLLQRTPELTRGRTSSSHQDIRVKSQPLGMKIHREM